AFLKLKNPGAWFLSIPQFSRNRVQAFGASYTLFGLFAVLNYIVPYFMWSGSDANHFSLHLTLRFLAASFCFLLIVHEYWPVKLQPWLPCFWHATLLYCLPFYATFMLLDNGCTKFWLGNSVLALFLLAAIVDWLSFTALLLLGAFLGYGSFLLVGHGHTAPLDYETIYSTVYLYAFAVIIGILFSRRNEKITQEKLSILQNMSASIAHEIRTPLASILINSQHLKKYFSKYRISHNLAKSAGLSVPNISTTEERLVSEIPTSMENIAKDTQNMVDMLLIKTRSYCPNSSSICSVNLCVDTAIERYPFGSNQREKIHWKKGADFHFLGNENLFIHVLLNLLKNSLMAIGAVDDGKIIIWMENTNGDCSLHFKDNGKGIAKRILPNLFEHFVTDSDNSAGIGLAFCKAAMRNFNGDIICRAGKDNGTEFIMSLPKTAYSAVKASPQTSHGNQAFG
ncbi:MAG TPA: HAMP domain-containing sensor histidine kinase, partial [Myxococcota bacterium]|nr:HAMP domain-containing sensor histidine kinase [Myxococcota bacterium]